MRDNVVVVDAPAAVAAAKPNVAALGPPLRLVPLLPEGAWRPWWGRAEACPPVDREGDEEAVAATVPGQTRALLFVVVAVEKEDEDEDEDEDAEAEEKKVEEAPADDEDEDAKGEDEAEEAEEQEEGNGRGVLPISEAPWGIEPSAEEDDAPTDAAASAAAVSAASAAEALCSTPNRAPCSSSSSTMPTRRW